MMNYYDLGTKRIKNLILMVNADCFHLNFIPIDLYSLFEEEVEDSMHLFLSANLIKILFYSHLI